MKQLPMIYGVGSSPVTPPAVSTAQPFRAEVQTAEGVWFLNVSFEGAKDLQKQLTIYLDKHSPGR